MSDTSSLSEAKRALLGKLMRGSTPQTSADTVTIPRRTQDGPIPLSLRQQQFWLLSQMAPDVPAYNEGISFHLPGLLNIAALEQSLEEIIRRHESWRTNFPLVNGQPIQMIHPPSPFQLPIVDLRSLSEAERETEALHLATREVNTFFDLTQSPPLRALLVRLGDKDHRLFLTLHHIIFDGYCVPVILQELSALYQAFSHGQPSPLADLPIQYADYALWQREALQGEVIDRHLSYWKSRLDGAPGELALPTDHPRPSTHTGRGALCGFSLPARLSDALTALAWHEGVTLFMTLLAAFNTLLYRYTGQEDLVIGTPVSGRKNPEVQGLLGVFINMLVLRTDLSGDPSFRELLKRTREVTLSAIAHEDLPFEHLVKELQPQRVAGQNPIFQVLLTLEPPVETLPSGWSTSQMILRSNDARIDLGIIHQERADGASAYFEYNSDLFDAATIKRMVGHWQTLLEAIVANPDQPLSALPILTKAERQQILGDWNATQRAFPTDSCIHQLFEQQVERTPNAVAVIYEGARLTYQELNARANQLAHYLRQLGVGPEVLVGLYIERSLEMVVGLLGILKAGGAYVPLDPAFPAERLAFMLADAQVPVLVTQQSLASGLFSTEAKIVCLDSDVPLLAEQQQTNPSNLAIAENLAYVIYTSGSTGRPKGVQILHRALVNFLLSMREQPGLTAEDTWLAVTTLSFDIAGLEFFLPLLVGARVVIASRETAVNGEALAETMARTGTTVMQATPVTWRLLMEAGWSGNPRLKILCGGEALSRDLAQQLLSKAASLWNLYGPTETTIWSTICQIKPGIDMITIGGPIANTQIYLLDAHLQPMPIGMPGELYIGGAGLARGYLNRPELTAERFVPDPFSAQSGARLYRTGDLARYLPTGEIEFLGRLDHQVKIRGFRIELGEIETLLRQHPAVRAAVVVAREDTPGDKRLVAYLVIGEGEPPAHHALRNFLKEQLPEYMVPSAFIMLEHLPLTPNGKVDRRALPAPDISNRVRDEIGALPSTPMELEVAAILAGFLKVEQIGLDQNFFMIGGNSLLGAQVMARMAETFAVKLSLRTLFDAPTVRELSAAIEEMILTKLEALSEDELRRLLG